MVKFGNSLDPDKEFDVLHGVLDFSVDDCLEEGEIADDWDIGDAQFLGPIASYILRELELPEPSNEEHDSASIAGPPELRESGFFHTQSAVSVLERSGSYLREKNLSIKSDNAFPARRSKRLRDKRINPELSTSKQTSNPPRKSKESRKRLPVALDLMRQSPKTVDNSLNVSDCAHQAASESCAKVVKKCSHCQSSKTTNWRGGPLGPRTLCNACGLRYRSGRLCQEYRPLLSPTFVPSQHSNFHKKVAEMRKEAKRLKVEIKTDGVPEQTQLHAKPWVPPSPTCVKTSFEIQLQNDDKSLDSSDRALLQNASNPCHPLVKKCAHCESIKTPLWKKGLLGPSALCNACGIRYGAGRLIPEYRPRRHWSDADVKIAAAPELRKSDFFHTQSAVSVLERSGSCSRQKSLSIKSDNAFPAQRSKQLKDKRINPELSTSKQTSNPRRSKESRKRLPVAMDLMRNSPKTVNNSLNVSDRARQTASESCPKVVKQCAHCQSSKTTIWRGGPLGPRTLCNACGLRYKSGRLCPEYRPLLSPTFVQSQHSNSHKKVVEMRNEAKRLKVEIKTDGFPEQTQPHAKPWVPPSPTCVKTSGEETSFEMQLQNDDKSLDSSDCALLQNGSNPCPPLVKKCAHCESTKTPLWKKGPLGPSTLCNACGIRYEAGRLVPEYRPRQYQPRPRRQWSHADVKRCCAHCETTNTPRWTKGLRTLCNACGIQYGAGHLVPEYRPRASPTFVPSQRSKNCRTSFKMRAKSINDSLTIDRIAGAPKQQHVETSTLSLLESNPSYFEAMHDDKPLDVSDFVSLQNGSNPAVGKKCAHCQSTMTPLWRSKPLGPYSLCNACGLQYQAGCLVLEYRPAASPTFVPSMHSNDRRDMKTMQCAAGIKIDESPELAYHVAASSSFIHPQFDKTPEQKQIEHMHVDTSSYMESSCSYSKNGPEHVKHMGAKQCVSPPSPCKKTSSEEKLSGVPVANNDDNSDGALLQNASGPCPAVIKKCTHCQSTKTLRWRKGPLGPQSLCDACGRLVPEYRPKASVTIISSQHSKDRSNIEKMMQSPASIEITGAPEQQHVEGMQPAKHVKTSTRVSPLESSPTYLRYKAKYFKDALCVPPPSPCKKISSVENDDDNSDSALVKSSSNPCPAVIKKCTHCESTKTPEWRKGPLGPSTLCSACNHQYRTGRLIPEYRPKASPTFVPGLHLNKRRDNLIKMQSNAGIEKRCARCESTKTPQWTQGPLGPSTLCAACGHQYRVGRQVREYQPRGSPTSVQASIPAFPYKAREDETEHMQ